MRGLAVILSSLIEGLLAAGAAGSSARWLCNESRLLRPPTHRWLECLKKRQRLPRRTRLRAWCLTSRLTAQSTKAIFPRLHRSSRHLADVQPPERWHALVFRAPQSAHVDPKRAPVRTLKRQAIPICTPYLAASAKIAAGGENGSIRPRTSDTPSLLDGNFGKAEKF